MTYCVALALSEGLVMLSDTRTNAGVDHISTFGKMHQFEVPGERSICLMTAGNLAITQSVATLLREGLDGAGGTDTLYTVPTMFKAAQLVGAAVRQVYHTDGAALREQGVGFDVSFLLGGQIATRNLRLFEIYAAGNFIEATTDGKPILDRAVTFDTPLYGGVKLALISMDSTLRSNLTVGLPIDLMVLRRGAIHAELRRRIGEDDPYFRMIRESWSEALREAYRVIPLPDWRTDPV